MWISNAAGVTVSQINATGWDADLVCPGARRITVDHIGETTGGHSVRFDNIAAIDHIGEGTGGHGVVVNHVLHVDHIAEDTGAHNIVLNNTETGSQLGTGNSVTGTITAIRVSSFHYFGDTLYKFYVMFRRAGVYRVWLRNQEAVPVNDHLIVTAVIGGAGFAWDSGGGAVPGGTWSDCGNITVAVNDMVAARQNPNNSVSQVFTLDFRNADGMAV